LTRRGMMRVASNGCRRAADFEETVDDIVASRGLGACFFYTAPRNRLVSSLRFEAECYIVVVELVGRAPRPKFARTARPSRSPSRGP
jgi:hypothetical protein